MSATMELLKKNQAKAKAAGAAGAKPSEATEPKTKETENVGQTTLEEELGGEYAEASAQEEPHEGETKAAPTPDGIKKMNVAALNAAKEEYGLEIEGWDKKTAPQKKDALMQAFGYASGVGAVAKSVQGEILPGDLISRAAHEIENIKDAETAAKLVRQWMEEADFNEFKVGGVLSVIQSQGWFGEHPNFKEFVTTEFGIEYRKAMYMIAIYNGLLESGVTWDQVKDVGWTKLKEIVGLLTQDNVTMWVEKAQAMNTLQLIEEVKAAKKVEASGGEGEGASTGSSSSTASTVVTKTFKCHPDQKGIIEEAIKKSKEISGTEVDTVALEHICLEFLGNGSGVKAEKADPKGMDLAAVFTAKLKKHGGSVEEALGEIFEAFEGVFPTVNVTVDMGGE